MAERSKAGTRFTKYLTTILRLSYDNAKVTIDLRRTSNLQNVLRSWWRGTVVERRSLAGELSLSCARPAADG